MSGLLRGLALMALVTVAAACAAPGDTDGPGATTGAGALVPVVVSPILTVGPDRFVYSLLDAATSEPVARPDRASTIHFRAPGAAVGSDLDGGRSTFIWAIEGFRGLYVSRVSFDRPGTWTADIELAMPDGSVQVASVTFEVRQTRPGASVGDAAPSIDHPTADDVGDDLSRLTSDTNPSHRLYERSLATALDEGRPVLVMFGTPGLCTTGFCAPALEWIKAAAPSAPSVTFVQLESYEMAYDGARLQPALDAEGRIQASAASRIYGLASETTVVAIDRAGVIREILDGFAGQSEIEAAIDLIR
jgi:hypothetical protein